MKKSLICLNFSYYMYFKLCLFDLAGIKCTKNGGFSFSKINSNSKDWKTML